MTNDRIRSAFTIQHHGDVVAVIDRYDPMSPTMSVTNDAENVVRYLHDQGVVRRERVLYRDTDGRWDELKHDGHGSFEGFAPVGASTLEQALAFIKGGDHGHS